MRRLICATIFLALLIANLAGAETKYVIKDLGILPGTRDSYAHAINSKGQVVCVSQTYVAGLSPKGEVYKMFLWHDGRTTEVKIPGGNEEVLLADINDSGQILISTYRGSFIVQGDTVKKIDGLPEHPYVYATAINNRADVVGRCEFGTLPTIPFLWHNGVTEALSVSSGCDNLEHVALNEKGQAAAIVRDTGQWEHCLLWDSGKMRVLEGSQAFGFIRDLSEDGTIVGEGRTSWGNQALVLRDGRCTNLRAPKGLKSHSASCINSKGIIAGICVTERLDSRPVVWDEKRVPTELPSLGGTHCVISDINDSGVIVGMAQDEKGISHAVMWTPVK